MKKWMVDHKHLWVLSLLFLANLAEVLPQLHHHEETHACMQQDGNYFYLEAVSAQASGLDSVPRLRGVERGENHDHPDCPLCHHFAGHLQDSFPTRLAVFEKSPSLNPSRVPLPRRAASSHHNRGPPQTLACS